MIKKKMIKDLIEWIKDYVKFANAKGVVIGMSGGKDSFVVAKLCALALGKENVFGIIMPNGEMLDKNDAVKDCECLGINYKIVNIKKCYDSILSEVKDLVGDKDLSSVTTINTAPRIRMTVLYAIAGTLNYLVANTSNLSEAMVGYTTKWGDNVGDFAPIKNLTKTEVCELGIMLGLPEKLVNKIPSDGLSDKSDEEKLGFSYEEIDDYVRHGKKGSNFDKIWLCYNNSIHKRESIKSFDPKLKNYFYEE